MVEDVDDASRWMRVDKGGIVGKGERVKDGGVVEDRERKVRDIHLSTPTRTSTHPSTPPPSLSTRGHSYNF